VAFVAVPNGKDFLKQFNFIFKKVDKVGIFSLSGTAQQVDILIQIILSA
jgi:hypothetical protein